MFDFVHENKRVAQVILALIILPFAFWGIDSYRKSGGGDALATVNGEKITPQEFDNAVRQQEGRMREMLGDKFDPAIFDKPEVRNSILDNLLTQHLMMSQAQASGLRVSDDQLAQIISGIEAFQADGKFDKQRYEAVLRSQSMTPLSFESRMRQEIALRQLTDAYTQNGYAAQTTADAMIRMNEQQRVVSTYPISPDAFTAQVKVDDAEIKAFYDKNPAQFNVPEQARVEYVVLSPEALMPQVAVDEGEIRKYYEEHKNEFGTPEQRHAAHILITVSPKATSAEKEAARAKAEQVLALVRKSPGKFAELARQYSQDPGSAVQGGDLGEFGRGMMVKPFEDAVFQMKAGEISGIVESDFGFHIIKLVGIVPAKSEPLEAVKASIAAKLKSQKAADRFTELADKFGNTAYEQSDTLQAAADLVKLPVQKSAWMYKGVPGPFPWTDKTLQAVFSKEVVSEKRNSAAVEIGPNTLIAVRMLEHKPASTLPLSDVSSDIRKRLVREKAFFLASKQGQAVLDQLKRGERVNVAWKKGRTFTRTQGGPDQELANMVFQMDASKLPSYFGAENPQAGYVLMRLDEVKDVGAIDDAKRARYEQELRKITGEAMLQDYVNESRKHASVSIKAAPAPAGQK